MARFIALILLSVPATIAGDAYGGSVPAPIQNHVTENPEAFQSDFHPQQAFQPQPSGPFRQPSFSHEIYPRPQFSSGGSSYGLPPAPAAFQQESTASSTSAQFTMPTAPTVVPTVLPSVNEQPVHEPVANQNSGSAGSAYGLPPAPQTAATDRYTTSTATPTLRIRADDSDEVEQEKKAEELRRFRFWRNLHRKIRV
ncbi:unnamed protein product, partial [Mesorhabditis spiculigera]